jgi:hypothetical protein
MNFIPTSQRGSCTPEEVANLASRLVGVASNARLELEYFLEGKEVPGVFAGSMKSAVEILERVDPTKGGVPLFLKRTLERQTGKVYTRADEEFQRDYRGAVARLSGIETFRVFTSQDTNLVANFLEDLCKDSLAVPIDYKRYAA